jgi:hypothetical protein
MHADAVAAGAAGLEPIAVGRMRGASSAAIAGTRGVWNGPVATTTWSASSLPSAVSTS